MDSVWYVIAAMFGIILIQTYYLAKNRRDVQSIGSAYLHIVEFMKKQETEVERMGRSLENLSQDFEVHLVKTHRGLNKQ